MILYVLVACCIVSIGYSKVFEIETVFTHLFYIPIDLPVNNDLLMDQGVE
jgi:uncharacterized membrane protein